MEAVALRQAFQKWGLPPEASVFLLKVWDAIQFLDDVKDGHAHENPDAGIYTLIFALPFDPFLAHHRSILEGAFVTAYHKWQAANRIEAEQDRSQLDKAYIWRAGYYDLVLLVVSLCMPREETEVIAPEVMKLYGESREDYVKEIVGA